MAQIIRLGARPSKLALIQAEQVKKKLCELNNNNTVEIIPIHTEGDLDQKSSMKDLGGKGVFIRTLEQALLDNVIDAAVHSFKDVTADLMEGTCLTSFFTPEAVTDCVVMSNNAHKTLSDLPKGSRVATGSSRRKLWLEQAYPELSIVPIRGNVDTRIKKCKEGFCDAVMLSTAALIRLGGANEISQELECSDCVPAPGQGVVTIQALKKSSYLSLLSSISDSSQETLSRLEFLFLKTIGLNCNYPLGLSITKKKHAFNVICKWASLTMNKLQTETLSRSN